MKICSRCKQKRQANSFYRQQSWCKFCCSVYYKEHRKKHPRLWAKWRKRCRARHGDAMRAAVRSWYALNKERQKQHTYAWKKRHPIRWKRMQQKRLRLRRARLRGLTEHFTQQQWLALKKNFNYRCAHCRRRTKLTVDHIIPLSKNGVDTIDNIQPLCKSCNTRKLDRIVA